MSYYFDQALELKRTAERVFTFSADDKYWNFDNAFGGWVAAIAAKAVKSDPEYRGEIISQHMQFISGVAGDNLYATITQRARKRQTDFWSVVISNTPDGSDQLAVAELVVGRRAAADVEYSPPLPDIKPTEDCTRLRANPMTPRWFDAYEILLAQGRPFEVNSTPRSIVYIRDDDKRPFDATALQAILDTPMPRVFFMGKLIRRGGTLSLSSHIYASDAEIAEVGDDFMILDTQCASIRHALSNQEAHLYRRDGLLLATSYQTSMFRLA